MRAFHTLRLRNSAPMDFERFTMILSALEWRKHNGEIVLVTDNAGADFVDDISDIWDNVDAALDAMDNFGIDENVFWAGAKIFALSRQIIPSVMIDLDFIVWRSLNFEGDLAVIHRESTATPCYPAADYFQFKNNFELPKDLNWAVEPCNAALVYFGNARFVAEYVSFAFEFMRAAAPANLSGWDLLPYMVFVEQRWMAMCADKLGVPIQSLSSLPELFGAQKYFTHVWGHKQFLRENPAAADKFCRDCAARIAHDFPAAANKISQTGWAVKYF